MPGCVCIPSRRTPYSLSLRSAHREARTWSSWGRRGYEYVYYFTRCAALTDFCLPAEALVRHCPGLGCNQRTLLYFLSPFIHTNFLQHSSKRRAYVANLLPSIIMLTDVFAVQQDGMHQMQYGFLLHLSRDHTGLRPLQGSSFPSNPPLALSLALESNADSLHSPAATVLTQRASANCTTRRQLRRCMRTMWRPLKNARRRGWRMRSVMSRRWTVLTVSRTLLVLPE